MSSEIDHPRQRTVAELLAEHGAGNATGRRRRRREEAEHDESAFVNGGAPPDVDLSAPDRSKLREPAAPTSAAPPRRVDGPRRAGTGRTGRFEQRGAPESSGPPRPLVTPASREPDPPRPADVSRAAEATRSLDVPRKTERPRNAEPLRKPLPTRSAAPPSPPLARPVRARSEPDLSTEQMPRVRRGSLVTPDPLLTAPLEQQKAAGDGDATVVGLAPAGADGRPRDRVARRRSDAGPTGSDDVGPPTQASAPFDLDDDHPAGLGTTGLRDDAEPDVEAIRPARVRPERSPGQAWAGVLAQWILGAIGGAALWVGFRYLWQEFTVVAVAAAVFVTIGLVLVVRHLLRNDDRRTTVFAVLVGLLLTVSPVLLVLLHRT